MYFLPHFYSVWHVGPQVSSSTSNSNYIQRAPMDTLQMQMQCRQVSVSHFVHRCVSLCVNHKLCQRRRNSYDGTYLSISPTDLVLLWRLAPKKQGRQPLQQTTAIGSPFSKPSFGTPALPTNMSAGAWAIVCDGPTS
ncbi:hypothetical protein PGT21_029111 [Puccinia graminis f. sp. tritici]|uniref:Uncharacterized protein n=1 Tax=Puccinia graminis f. sp. tritici TaxID=56615 RepID=A0A5B0RS50_PUCGR|nr:hypothetical protein PGT21_029111 [Puccinia graminis f. sp. tritici]KAA1128169.1 hypothetical protein PGTUg99_018779 [Puccinia graminis f. sp. tritici]